MLEGRIRFNTLLDTSPIFKNRFLYLSYNFSKYNDLSIYLENKKYYFLKKLSLLTYDNIHFFMKNLFIYHNQQ